MFIQFQVKNKPQPITHFTVLTKTASDSFYQLTMYCQVVEMDCQACKLNKEDAMDRSRWRKLIKGYLMIRTDVTGRMFLLVLAHPGSPVQAPLNTCVHVCVYLLPLWSFINLLYLPGNKPLHLPYLNTQRAFNTELAPTPQQIRTLLHDVLVLCLVIVDQVLQ